MDTDRAKNLCANSRSDKQLYHAEYCQRGNWGDFHTHILPNMDDGSRSVEESLEMLDESARQGVGYVILTPHFYAGSDNPSSFLNRRSKSLSTLKEHLDVNSPLLISGAEVQYFSGITAMEELPLLCIEKTDLLLLEMPFQKWSSRVINDVLELNSRRGLRVIIAHIERYIREQPDGVLDTLLLNHVLIQANAEFFVNRFSRRRALSMLKKGCIHLLGSDCHNLTSRPPMMGECIEVIRTKLGNETASRLQRIAFDLLLSEHEQQMAEN